MKKNTKLVTLLCIATACRAAIADNLVLKQNHSNDHSFHAELLGPKVGYLVGLAKDPERERAKTERNIAQIREAQQSLSKSTSSSDLKSRLDLLEKEKQLFNALASQPGSMPGTLNELAKISKPKTRTLKDEMLDVQQEIVNIEEKLNKNSFATPLSYMQLGLLLVSANKDEQAREIYDRVYRELLQFPDLNCGIPLYEEDCLTVLAGQFELLHENAKALKCYALVIKQRELWLAKAKSTYKNSIPAVYEMDRQSVAKIRQRYAPLLWLSGKYFEYFWQEFLIAWTPFS